MAPARYSLLALLVLASSSTGWALPYDVRNDATRRPKPSKHTKSKPGHYTPPVLPTPSHQISLSPPKYSVSWDTSGPDPTDDPELPPIIPHPSNQISLGPPKYSISWDGQGPEPTSDDPGDGPPVFPTPSNQISLYPPSYSISWDGEPTPTSPPSDPEDPPSPPDYPTPSNQISLYPPSYSVSWDAQPEPTPADPIIPPVVVPLPTNNIGLQPPRYSISWYKRQEDEPEPTGEPDPEDPGDDDPIEIPLPPQITPPNSVGIQPPQASISWGKRQYDEDPEPTAAPEPEDPEPEPGFPIELPPLPIYTPKNSIGIQPPHYSIIWGKRQDDEEPTEIPVPPLPTPPNEISIVPPKASVSWGKREAEPATNSFGFQFPTYSIWLPKPTKPVYVSWGKRQEDDGPTEIPPEPQPTPPDQISIQPPEPSISWGKRDAEPATNSIGFQFPTYSVWLPKPSKPVYVSWGKRQFEYGPEPTDSPTPEDPEEPIPEDPEPEPEPFPGDDFPFPLPNPPNSVGIQPPSATIIWGKDKREAEAAPQSNDVGIQPPSATIIWGKDKREAEAAPQSNDVGIQPPKATIIWGKDKRNADAEADPQSNDIGIQPPTASIIWGKEKRGTEAEKREADADAQNSWGLVWPTNIPYPPWYTPQPTPTPTNGYISWGKREADPQKPTYSVSWSYPKPPKPTKPGKPTKRTSTRSSSSTQNGWISWGKRDAVAEITPAPVEGNKPKPSSCPITTTVTRPIPCPLIICPIVDPPIVDPNLKAQDATEIMPEPSEHLTLGCPVTVTVPSKCPTRCIIPTPPPAPTKTTHFSQPTYRPISTPKFITSVRTTYLSTEQDSL